MTLPTLATHFSPYSERPTGCPDKILPRVSRLNSRLGHGQVVGIFLAAVIHRIVLLINAYRDLGATSKDAAWCKFGIVRFWVTSKGVHLQLQNVGNWSDLRQIR